MICFRTFHELLNIESLQQVDVGDAEGCTPTVPCDKPKCTGESGVAYCTDCEYKLCEKHLQVLYFSSNIDMYV